ncbi:hypothetical protein FACS1894124_1670 [Spirochaetia bacterium]|nr:hypothetical protein FACS1894124_1670 [Spirochaetia bacterium]
MRIRRGSGKKEAGTDDENPNNGYSSHIMRVGSIVGRGQVLVLALIWALAVVSCDKESRELAIVPPVTPPLSRSVIGYGVISVSYTHVVAEPNQSGLSLGYLRKGSIVEVLQRRLVNRGGSGEAWVFVEGSYRGWLREDVIQVYDNEGRARTAAESLSQ